MSVSQQRQYPAYDSKYAAPSMAPVTPRRSNRSDVRMLSVTLPREASSSFDFSLPSPLATPPASPPRSSARKIELPIALPRAAFPPVDPRSIESLDPELRGVPVEYVAHKLRSIGPE
ncbi:hypothetical protein FRC12_010556 [Ceratobasidium sp. 428]|nr:hypothetical protein FRC12_010556 [Ceratobasidium sp. 428]